MPTQLRDRCACRMLEAEQHFLVGSDTRIAGLMPIGPPNVDSHTNVID